MMKKALKLVVALVATFLLTMLVASADSGVITGNGVNFRWSPSLQGGVIRVFPKGTVVTANGAEGDWTKVSYAGVNGYVFSKYIQVRPEYTDRGAERDRTDVSKGQQVVDYAKQFLGTPYVYGGTSPSGFDCSGLVYYTYKQFGVTLNRTAAGMGYNGTWVAKGNLQPGDIVLFTNGGSGVGHAGIYVGDGMMIHAVKPGVPVRYDTINSGYYANHYVVGRRIF